MTLLDLLDDASPAVDEDVTGIRFVSFSDDHVAELEMLLLEHGTQAVSPIFRQKAEKRRAIQDFVLVLRHGAPIGGKIHRTKRPASSEK